MFLSSSPAFLSPLALSYGAPSCSHTPLSLNCDDLNIHLRLFALRSVSGVFLPSTKAYSAARACYRCILSSCYSRYLLKLLAYYSKLGWGTCLLKKGIRFLTNKHFIQPFIQHILLIICLCLSKVCKNELRVFFVITGWAWFHLNALYHECYEESGWREDEGRMSVTMVRCKEKVREVPSSRRADWKKVLPTILLLCV